MSGQSGGQRLRLAKLNEQLTCKLCGGYFIDATTIIECLHSFCRSCIVKYLENNKYCPICEVQVHKSRPLLNIRPDRTLQDIVYKLVPGCYQNEMRCRREFYSKHPEARSQATTPEARGEPVESHIYSPDESLSLSLEYYDPHAKEPSESSKEAPSKALPRRYLRCPAAVTVFHLQKLIRAKYGLTDAHRVDIMYKEEPLCSSYTLMDVMYIYHWRRKVPLHLSYRIFESSPKRIKLSEDNVDYKKSLSSAGIDSVSEMKEDKSPSKREWKEVQLKISETGVMSVTDISSPDGKRGQGYEDVKASVEASGKTNQQTKLEETSVSIDGSDRKIGETNGNASRAERETEAKRVVQTGGVNNNNNTNSESDTKVTQKSEQKDARVAPGTGCKVEENLPNNNNNNNNNNNTNNNNKNVETEKKPAVESQKPAKTANAGSKIDALSAKLQFQPKMGQVNNTYSKKLPKEKRTVLHSRKPETKTSETSNASENGTESKTRANCASPKTGVFPQQRQQPAATHQTSLESNPVNRESSSEKVSNVRQPPPLERRVDSSEESSQKPNHVGTYPESTTFPYGVRDLVNDNSSRNTGQKEQKDSLTCCPQQLTLSTVHSSNSLRNSYGATSQSTTTTTTVTSSKVTKSFEGYSVPPCPDAIPISLMKPTIRKHEIIAKGTNLNEICAKIGNSGSKINDICAKIGESSKEKSRAEARSKPEIPDLLKIARVPSNESIPKHIPNVPTVPLYTEAKNVYSTPKSSSPSTSGCPVTSSMKLPLAKKQPQPVGYKTLRDPPKSWNPTLSKNNYVAAKNQSKDVQSQPQGVPSTESSSKQIPSKPAKIFKMRNVPRYLGNPASGVKPMYGVASDTKDKDRTTSSSKSTTLSMMKIDPKTLSPIVSTVNSPIVSPPPYSPNARTYQSPPFSRDICRSTGSPISPRNSPVNMLSTNPFIPSPTPNTNPRLIYSHFPPPFPDASRFPNPLIRSPIGIPPPSAFHSSLPPSINKLYQRTSYIPQTTGYGAASPAVSQPPTVQRIPPSTHSSSPRSPKTTSPPGLVSPSSTTATSTTTFDLTKPEVTTCASSRTVTSSVESVALLLSKGASRHQETNAFNLSKTGSTPSDLSKEPEGEKAQSPPKLEVEQTASKIKASPQESPSEEKKIEETEENKKESASPSKSEEKDDEVVIVKTMEKEDASGKTKEQSGVEADAKVNGDVSEKFNETDQTEKPVVKEETSEVSGKAEKPQESEETSKEQSKREKTPEKSQEKPSEKSNEGGEESTTKSSEEAQEKASESKETGTQNNN